MTSEVEKQESHASTHRNHPFTNSNESWDRASAAYAVAVARSSRKAAPRLIAMANALCSLEADDARALELAAGTGPLTVELRQCFPRLDFVATDRSPGMLGELKVAVQRDENENPPQVSQPSQFALLDMTTLDETIAPPMSYSHVFCSMALQVLGACAGTALDKWVHLLRPGGVLAIGVWDYDRYADLHISALGPHAIWAKAAQSLRPSYQDLPDLPEGSWMGGKRLELGMREAGLLDVRVERCEVGFNVGTQEFMSWFWESGNPDPLARIESFGDEGLEEVKTAMKKIVQEEYDDGRDIPLWTALAVGRKRVP